MSSSASSSSDPGGAPDAAAIFDEERIQSRLALIRAHVARPVPKQPWDDARPALIPFRDDGGGGIDRRGVGGGEDGGGGGGGIIVGGARHAANIPLLKDMDVTAVLNCASGGIARLPVDELKECGIRYAFTNYTYPILHEKKRAKKRPENLERMMKGISDSEEQIVCSQHLDVSNSLFADVRRQNGARDGKRPAGNVLFFCVAGQNRSAALAAATLMLHGKPLEDILPHCARQRPFVLENVGFQRQLVELEAIVERLRARSATALLRDRFGSHWALLQHAQSASRQSKRVRVIDEEECYDERLISMTSRGSSSIQHSKSEYDLLVGKKVEIELLIPGLCTMEVRIPKTCTIPTVKRYLVQHANKNLLRHDRRPARVAKSWMILAMFGYDDMYDLPLEVEAVEIKVQLKRMRSMFGLTAKMKDGQPHVTWNERCRFALCIMSIIRIPKVPSSSSVSSDSERMEVETTDADPERHPEQEPWTFVHEERPNAPATLLENTLRSTHLRAWDFVTGEALASKLPIVFSFADDPRDRRAFMMVSRSANTPQQFHAPGEGDILGMGENAIVHRVQLSHVRADGGHRDEHWTRVNVGLQNTKPASDICNGSDNNLETRSVRSEEEWDAAVKRPFSLGKMLVFLQASSEAGLAKRLRLANLLNSDKRVLYFYGLGLGLSTNAYNQNEYKFELMLLAKYEEDFSTYTMRRFMEEYMSERRTVTSDIHWKSIKKMQSGFSITSVKVLLVSLLNAFRDLTLMGVQAFDFNHLNNVLVSRDYQSVRLIDIDGNAQGSINYPCLKTVVDGNLSQGGPKHPPQKPCLNVDLNILLPSVIEQLILGKGRGRSFVSNTRSEIWRAKPEDGKAMIRTILMGNFYSSVDNHETEGELRSKAQLHVTKVAEWFYAMMKKQPPWINWTHDIYDAMRCIDHLPIS